MMDTEFFEPYLVKDAPKTVYYIPNYITAVEEQYLIKQIYNAPKPKWTCLANRKLQDYGGIPHKKGLIPEKIPDWLLEYMDRVSDLNVFNNSKTPLRSNHCLINEYKPGQGILPHLDGPVFSPTITTISLGSHTVLELFTNEDGKFENVCKLLLEPRSLIVLKDDMYQKYLHGISEIFKDTIDESCVNLKHCGVKRMVGDTLERETRLSLTIRNCPKVFNCNLFNLNNKNI